MEVHAHTHTPRKKWTHYFWEFLMLFLAVFCGFMAENQREHMIDHKRERKYMETLLEDLVRDTVDLQQDAIFWNRKLKQIDTIKSELNKKPAERNPGLLYRWAGTLYNASAFSYHDRTVNQLKNAGNFRLIRKKNVSDSLSNYDSYIINVLKFYEATFGENRRDHESFQEKFFNSEYFHLVYQPHLFDSAVAIRPDIITMRNRDENLFFEYYNTLNSHGRGCRFTIVTHKTAMRRATNLINLIKSEYHLE